MSQVSSDRRPLLYAVAIFAIALVIRLLGVTWGLPNDLHNDSLHPDETVVYYNYAYHEDTSPLVPGNYNYPTLYPLILRVAGDMVAQYGGIDPPVNISRATDLQDLKNRLSKNSRHQRAVNLAGRVLNCIAGAGAATVIFFLMLRVAGLISALFAGALMSVAPALVLHSRFQTVDVLALLLMWLAIFYALKLYQNERGRAYDYRYAILAGLFAGLSTGTKYTGAVALLSLFFALILRKDRRAAFVGVALASAAVCAVSFVLSTPGCLLDTSQFMFGVTSEMQHMKEGHDLVFVNTPSGFIYQIGNLYTGIGPLACLAGIAGLAYAAFKRYPWVWVILPTVLAYYVIVGRSEVKFVRYGLPLIPAICIGFGYAVGAAVKRPKLRVAGGVVGAVSILGLESLANLQPSPYFACFDPRFGGLVGTIRYTADMMKEDPRDAAARYVFDISKNDPNTTVGVFREPWFWTVSVLKDATFLYNMPDQMNAQMTSAFFVTNQPRLRSFANSPNMNIERRGPSYAVLTSFETTPFDRIENEQQVPDVWLNRYRFLRDRLTEIRANYTVVATFGDDAPAVEDLMHAQTKAYVLKHR